MFLLDNGFQLHRVHFSFKEEKLLKALVQLGVRSGASASLEMEVDALPFYNTHAPLIEKLLHEVQH